MGWVYLPITEMPKEDQGQVPTVFSVVGKMQSTSLASSGLFVRQVDIQYPPDTASADSIGSVVADDTLRYYIKTDKGGDPIRASEWISTHICERIGIPAPTAVPIQLRNGDLVFGSRQIYGVGNAIANVEFLSRQTFIAGVVTNLNLTRALSAIYVFDMFIHNDDRHAGNLLIADRGRTQEIIAYDFGRGLFWRWPLNGFKHENPQTVRTAAVLRRYHGFDKQTAFLTIDKLLRLDWDIIEGFIKEMPSDWLNANLRIEFMNWWISTDRVKRLEMLRAGIDDGSLL